MQSTKLIKKEKPKISSQRRELIFKVLDDFINPGMLRVVHELTNYRYCDNILLWLIANKITGKELNEFLNIQFKGSILSMVQYVVKIINKDNEIKPIIYGKDYK